MKFESLLALIVKAFSHSNVEEQDCVRMIASWLKLRLHYPLFDIATLSKKAGVL